MTDWSQFTPVDEAEDKGNGVDWSQFEPVGEKKRSDVDVALDAPYRPNVTRAASKAAREGAAPNPELASRPTGSVMDGVKAQDLPPVPGVTVSRAPVKPEVRAAIQQRYDSASPAKRRRLVEAGGFVGQIATEAKQRDDRIKSSGSNALKSMGTSAELRAERMIAGDKLNPAGMDPEIARNMARTGAALGTTPGMEVPGIAGETQFDFDTAKQFQENPLLSSTLARGLAKGGLELAGGAAGIGEAMADFAFGSDSSGKGASEWIRQKSEAIGESRGDYFARNLEGAISSLSSQIPSLVVGAVTGSTAISLASMAYNSFGNEYLRGKQAGLDPSSSAARASLFAAFETIGESFGLGGLIKTLGKAAQGIGTTDELLKFFASNLSKEIPGELLTTTGQFGVDKVRAFGLNTEAGWSSYLQQVGDTITQTLMQGGLQAAATTGVATAARFLADGAPRGNPDLDAIRQAADAARAAQAQNAAPGAIAAPGATATTSAPPATQPEPASQAPAGVPLVGQPDPALPNAGNPLPGATPAENAGAASPLADTVIESAATREAGLTPVVVPGAGPEVLTKLQQAAALASGEDLTTGNSTGATVNAITETGVQNDSQGPAVLPAATVGPALQPGAQADQAALESVPGAASGEALGTGVPALPVENAEQAGVQPVDGNPRRLSDLDLEADRRLAVETDAELQASAAKIGERKGAPPPRLIPSSQPGAQEMAQAWSDATGFSRPIMFHDPNSQVGGMYYKGRMWVNTASPTGSLYVAGHESFHEIERAAEAGDTKAAELLAAFRQAALPLISEDGRREYGTKHLFKSRIEAAVKKAKAEGKDPLAARVEAEKAAMGSAELGSELSADGVAQVIARDPKKFFQSLQKQAPEQFGPIVTKLLDVVRKFKSALAKRMNLGAKDVLKHIKDLDRFESEVKKLLVEWKASRGESVDTAVDTAAAAATPADTQAAQPDAEMTAEEPDARQAEDEAKDDEPGLKYSLMEPDFDDPKDRVEVSTTVPSAKKGGRLVNSAITQKRIIDSQDVFGSETHFAAAEAAIRRFNTVKVGDKASAAEELRKVVVENLLWLYDKMPEGVRERAKLWYDGANRIATEWAKRWGVDERKIAGVLAVLSPQKDWFMNVSLAERLATVYFDYQNEPWSPQMTKWVESYVAASKDVQEREKRAPMLAYAKRLEGKTLTEMSTKDGARFIRVFDETFFPRQYRVVTPEGGFGEYVTNEVDEKDEDADDVPPGSVAWGSYPTIEKGLEILRARGDETFTVVSEGLGKEHKVRNFYNNIIRPGSKDGHVTIDTHAIAAALFKALSGAATEVMQNFGTSKKGVAGAGSNADTGASGLYGIFADAYREAAAKRNILAREMQSITWEAIRSIFLPKFKTKHAKDIEKIWDRYQKGEISREQARDEAFKMGGGLKTLPWEGTPEGRFPSEDGVSFDKNIPADVENRKARTLDPVEATDKVRVSMSATTNSIPGIKDLYEKAASGDPVAHGLLQDIAVESLKQLLGGTSAKIKADRVTGLYGGDIEPAIGVSVSFKDADRAKVLAGLARFADNFNQEQVHIRGITSQKVGAKFEDGSYVTPVYRWEMNRALSRDEVQKVVDESGLFGLTFADGFVEAYFVGDIGAKEDVEEFRRSGSRVSSLLGGDVRSTGQRASRLWVYGRGEGAIGYERIRGDVPAEAVQESKVARRVAEYLRQGKVKVFEQAEEVTEKQRALQARIARVYELLPDNDLGNPLVKRAYDALATEVLRQFQALPIKVEIFEGKGEPYKNSAEMRRDVVLNNHLFIYATTPSTFGPEGVDFSGHPLLGKTLLRDANGKPLLYNDLLRAVHDYFAHTMSPTQFGPKGEEAAWKNHMSMTGDPWARWALTSETRGQNSWVNFRDDLDPKTPAKDRPFARQKAALMQAEYSLTGNAAVDAPMKELIKTLTEAEKLGSVEANLKFSIDEPVSTEPAAQARLKSAMLGKQVTQVEDVVGEIPSARLVNGSLEVDPQNREAAGNVLAAADVGIKFSLDESPPPKKTVKAYKLFKVMKSRPGQLFPLFVKRAGGAPFPVGVWVDAQIGEMKDGKVKSSLGPLAPRPGVHAGDLPIATHIGSKSSPAMKAPDLRAPDHVWAEVLMPDDVDWQTEANSRAERTKDGRIKVATAHITDQLPVGGHYRYKTNASMTGNWLIAGSMKITKILTDAEVKAINDAAGVADLPRAQPLDLKAFGFDEDNLQFSTDPDASPEIPRLRMIANGKRNWLSEDGRFRMEDAGYGSWVAEDIEAREDYIGDSRADALDWLKRRHEAAYLAKAGAKMEDKVTPQQGVAIVEGLRRLHQLGGATRFSTPPAEVKDLQGIIDHMTGGDPSFWVEQDGEDVTLTHDGRRVAFVSPKTADRSTPNVAEGDVYTDTSEFDRDGGGTMWYQALLLWAARNQRRLQPDFVLTHINTFRRTEQMINAALRAGTTKYMRPHPDQRVYGWDENPETPEADRQNILRLALAAERNVFENAPELADIGYNVKSGQFTRKGKALGTDAIRDLLDTGEPRAAGIGSSTLARAIVIRNLRTGSTGPAGVEAAYRALLELPVPDAEAGGPGRVLGEGPAGPAAGSPGADRLGKPLFYSLDSKRDPEQAAAIRANAAKIAAMPEAERDDTEVGDFPGAADAFHYYEASKLAPKPMKPGTLKRVTDRNSFDLGSSYEYVANVDGELFGVNKDEDPDEVDDDTKFVYRFNRMDAPFDDRSTTSDDKDELWNEMRQKLADDERAGAKFSMDPSTDWRDDAGRLQFKPGAIVYKHVANLANAVLDKVRMKPISTDLSRRNRQMKSVIQKAQDLTVDIGKDLFKLTPDQREMISDIIEGELAAGVTPPKELLDIAASITAAMSAQSTELVRLGMITQEAADRWSGRYLPRFYEPKLRGNQDPWWTAVTSVLRKPSALLGIKGQSFRGRGKFETIDVADLPGYLKAGWEIRDEDYVKGTSEVVQVWKDYTRDEREAMGEMRDAAFRFIMGYNASQKDIALGRLFEGLAKDVAKKNPPDKTWVRVPETLIEDTYVRRYGKLAGQYVPREVFDHISQHDAVGEMMKIYRQALSMWKEGKALALDTPIPTPSGWTTMGDLREGDTVFDERGNPCEVTFATPVQFDRECFEVEFSDGEKIVADAEHLWFTVDRGSPGVRTTKTILETLKYNGGRFNRHSIPVAGALSAPAVDLPVDPYFLGVWLGNGSSRRAEVTSCEADSVVIMSELARRGFGFGSIRKDPRGDSVTYGVGFDERRPREMLLQPVLRSTGVLCNKHIPAIYLRAHEDQRMDLLRGLMDTDGTIDANGKVSFCTASEAIADGFMELARSLGFKPAASRVEKTHQGGKSWAWVIRFHATSGRAPFLIERKRSRLKPPSDRRARSGTRQIIAVRPVNSVPVRCIQVSSESRLYLAGRGMVPTHNTVLNPVSHANNVLSNLTMAHFAGVSYWDAHKYVGTVRDFVKNAPMVSEARDAGLFQGTMSREELMEVMPEQLRMLAQMEESRAKRAVDAVWNAMAFWLRKPMGKAYEAEDLFFRYLIYRDARGRGLTPDDAVDYAQRYIFTYDDLPMGARKVRDFALPFFSYTYKVVPVLAHTVLTHPWRFAAPAAILHGINAAMYAMVYGDDEDDWREKLRKGREGEKVERKNLPPWIQGMGAVLGTPKAIRLGTDEVTGLPLFMDISRVFPGGDLLDVNSNTGALPWFQTLTPSSPILTTMSAMFYNRDSWSGKDLIDKNDTSGEKAEKVGSWLWRQFTPAIAVNNYHWDRGMNALSNKIDRDIPWFPNDYTGTGRDGLPVQPGLTALQTVGIKVRPYDLDLSGKINESQQKALIRNLQSELRQINRLEARGAMSERQAEAKRELARTKIQRVRGGLTVDGDKRFEDDDD